MTPGTSYDIPPPHISDRAQSDLCTVQSCHWDSKADLWRQMLRKSSLEHAFDTTYVQNYYFDGKCSENRYFKMHLAPHMCKTITVKANAKEIIIWKCIWHQICTKSLLWRQMLRKSSLENAFDVKFVQNVTVKANAQKIITFTCIWHQICTKS